MDNEKKRGNYVFYISLFFVIFIVAWGIFFSNSFTKLVNNIFRFLTNRFGWLYLVAMFSFVLFAIYLAFSKYGNIKLGPDDSEPEFSNLSWFGMLFGAGMGIGLVFWGVAEPLSHFANPPLGIEPGSTNAMSFSMKSSFMHWGIHPWANYSVIGLALAYMQFRKERPGLISSIFIPLIGEERAKGALGKFIDISAVFATVAGVATSLGLGTLQINSGLDYLFGIPVNIFVQIIIISVITLIFIWTAVSGIEKGIKILGDLNLVLATILLVLVILLGPTLKIVNMFISSLGNYLQYFIEDSLSINAFEDNTWLNTWRIFYWSWWIAWAPFVGTFIARISKGRTIREFIIGVTLVPALVSLVWFAAFGTMGLNYGRNIDLTQLRDIVSMPSIALFEVFKHYPLTSILSIITIFLLCTFFITSANSATFVLSMLTSNGNLNPSNKKKVLWGLIQSLLATALLLSGGLAALQTASIVAAFPFIFIMIFSIVSIIKSLREEKTDKV